MPRMPGSVAEVLHALPLTRRASRVGLSVLRALRVLHALPLTRRASRVGLSPLRGARREVGDPDVDNRGREGENRVS
jgi:hypothetical protein